MVRYSLVLGTLAGMAMACQPPPPNTKPTATTEPPTNTGTTSTTSSTTFPTETTFGGTNNQEPDHFLHVMEIGQWQLTPPGGPYTGLSGTVELTEIVDELDTEEGPDCLVTWALTGSEPLLSQATCPGCDETLIVDFAVSIGDPSTCQSPDLPPNAYQSGWRMSWNPADQTIYRDINATGVWVAWWPGTKVGDTIDFTFSDTMAIFVEEEEM